MNTIGNTEKPRLKLNLAAKPLTLNTNANPLVTGPTLKKVVVFQKPKGDIKDAGNSPATSDKKDVSTAATKGKSETVKKSKKQEAVASNKQVVSGKKAASQKVV